MQKVIGTQAVVTNHSAEIKGLTREGIYPHPPLKIHMNEPTQKYFSIKVQGRQSPMVLIVESYDHYSPVTKPHHGFELHWSLIHQHPSGDCPDENTNGTLPPESKLIMIDAPDRARTFQQENFYIGFKINVADECHSLCLLTAFGAKQNQKTLF